MTRLIVATDGSCYPNPGPGGWAWVNAAGDHDSGAKADTTNNAMELTAIGMAIAANPGPLLIQSDSSYAIGCIAKWGPIWERNGWRTKAGEPVKNARLISRIRELLDVHDVEFEWVRGHNGHELNERADELAGAARGRVGQ